MPGTGEAGGVSGTHPARIRVLNWKTVQPGSFVLPWVQASVRAGCSHALEYAIGRANELRKPVVACFVRTTAYPGANERHYAFLLEGLADAGRALRKRGIPRLVQEGEPPAVIDNPEAGFQGCHGVDAGWGGMPGRMTQYVCMQTPENYIHT